MKFIASLKATPWRPVIGLLLAGLLGWIAAWLMLPSDRTAAPSATSKTVSTVNRSQVTPAPTLPGSPDSGRTETAPLSPSLEQLLQRQEAVSQGAARSVNTPTQSQAQPQPGSNEATSAVPVKPTSSDALSGKLKAMRVLQTTALADIQAVPPGDAKKMMAAMERFDTQMRAAGAPSIIDMDNLRKMLESSDRIQLLNRQLMAEADKGRSADASKIKTLSQEIQSVQLAMPKQVIKTDVVQKLMAK